ncbi:TRAP transporter large permease subunit [Marivibrio halodurans]|uniref:TRAP transporter large permease n=1 Tax=Marivibrio halodurans TaxID=2039722 RepID=UPI0031BB4905
MEWWVTLGGTLALLLGLFLTGVPIFVAFLIVNVGGVLLLMGPSGFGMFTNSVFETATTSSLATIALFILMGELLFRSGTIDVVFDSVDKLVGRLKGRQYLLSVSLSTILGALSGSALGVSAMMARTLYRTMVGRGYDGRLSCGTILAGASLAPIIPPSLLVIIIGTLANVSIAKLLLAGLLPGLLLAAVFAAYALFRVHLNPDLAPPDTGGASVVSFREKLRAALRLGPFSVIMFSVMGFILLGIATPSEAAATGVAGTLLTAAYYRKLNWRMVWNSLVSAAGISSMILLIMASSAMFSQLLAFTGTTTNLVEFVAALDLPGPVMLFVLMLVPFLLCMFIDQIALLLILIPIYQPILTSYGFDPIWFWTLMLINVTIGGMTPPFGYTMFAFKGGAGSDISINAIYRASWPFVGLFVLTLILLAALPGLVLFLPAML